MADPVVECVPNFSEGRRMDVVEAIATAIRNTPGCSLLDVDPGASTNRTVYTFVGPPVAVVKGALNAAKVAFKLIDMSKHKGEHPRLGALDVCPFVPVANVSMAECVQLSRDFGQQLATELGVPVFLYECSQEVEFRKSLSQIRAGEYEGLEAKLSKPEWTPDFGPAEFVPSWGATVTGARNFLVAYNVNLLGTKQQAHRIALLVREKGRDQPGRLKSVKALGWYLDEKDLAQISMNLCDYEATPLHVAFEECSKHAQELNLAVVGSEIVGLLPLKALLMVADYYISKENLFILHERQKVRLAVERLGLSSLTEFKPEEKIIEYQIGTAKDGPLVSSSLRSFVESLGARTSTPGGGSAAACVASMGAALAAMVGQLTFGYKKYEELDPLMRATIAPLHHSVQRLLPLVDRDTEAFSGYMEALKLPQKTQEEKAKREEAMDAGLKKAIAVPLGLMRVARECWPHMETLGHHGNITAISDLQVGARVLDAGIHGAYYNVCINLKQVKDSEYVAMVTEEVEAIVKESTERCSQVLQLVSERK